MATDHYVSNCESREEDFYFFQLENSVQRNSSWKKKIEEKWQSNGGWIRIGISIGRFNRTSIELQYTAHDIIYSQSNSSSWPLFEYFL